MIFIQNYISRIFYLFKNLILNYELKKKLFIFLNESKPQALRFGIALESKQLALGGEGLY